MAHKPYRHNEVSNIRKCTKCGTFLKLNLLAKNINADQCYRCFKNLPVKPVTPKEEAYATKRQPTILKDMKEVLNKFSSKRLK